MWNPLSLAFRLQNGLIVSSKLRPPFLPLEFLGRQVVGIVLALGLLCIGIVVHWDCCALGCRPVSISWLLAYSTLLHPENSSHF
jgi:hypothetical protein